jgi:hypothetical protein
MGWPQQFEVLVLEIKSRNDGSNVADIANRFEATKGIPARTPADIDQWFREFQRGIFITKLDAETRLLVRELMTTIYTLLPPGETRREAVDYIVTVLRRSEATLAGRQRVGFRL